MKTAAQQIGAYKLLSENKPTAYDAALLLSMIEEAERRAEQRVRAEIARDSERLDWLGCNLVSITINGTQSKRRVLSVQLSGPLPLLAFRQAIDAAQGVG